MFVKICGLSTAEHVQAAVDAGADAVGFVFAESVREIDPVHATAISKSVPVTVKKVAVMRHPSNAMWRHVLSNFSPDVLQMDAEDFDSLDIPAAIESWPVFREGNKVTIPVETGTAPFVYEGARSGAGETVDWASAAILAERGNMILAGGLGVDNVAAAITTVRPFGVDVSSGVESAPGRKDSGLIRDFISAARAVGKNL